MTEEQKKLLEQLGETFTSEQLLTVLEIARTAMVDLKMKDTLGEHLDLAETEMNTIEQKLVDILGE